MIINRLKFMKAQTNKVMKQFMYLLRGGDSLDELSPEEMEAHMGLWKSWMGGLAEQGKLAGGLPLSKEGKQVTNGDMVTDGPFAAGKEVVGGYIIVNAETMDEAIQTSLGCPILKEANGNVEVREPMEM